MKEETYPETYSVNLKCTNCGNEWQIKIKCGKEITQMYECPNCECYRGEYHSIPERVKDIKDKDIDKRY